MLDCSDSDFETVLVKRKQPSGKKEKNQPLKKKPKIQVMGYAPITNNRIRTRSSPYTLCELIEKLTDEKVDVIKKMGFGSVLNYNINCMPTRLGYWLLSNYNPTSNVLNLGYTEVTITTSLVRDILGIPMGDIQLKELNKPTEKDQVVAEFRQQFQKIPTAGDVVDFIHSSTDTSRLFTLNFLVVFNTIMGETSQGGTVNMKFLTSLKMGVDITTFDWCSYLLTCLRRTKAGWNGKQHYNGPLVFLAV